MYLYCTCTRGKGRRDSVRVRTALHNEHIIIQVEDKKLKMAADYVHYYEGGLSKLGNGGHVT